MNMKIITPLIYPINNICFIYSRPSSVEFCDKIKIGPYITYVDSLASKKNFFSSVAHTGLRYKTVFMTTPLGLTDNILVGQNFTRLMLELLVQESSFFMFR